MTKKFICSNNEQDYRLNESGVLLGSNMMCLRRGIGMGLHQHISNEDEFLKHWSGGYRPHVKQQLYCGDGALPPGHIKATAPQCMARGFGLGSLKRAKQLKRGKASSVKQTSAQGTKQPTQPKQPTGTKSPTLPIRKK